MSDYSYIGVGKVYMRITGNAAPMVEVGNCSALNFKIDEETKELKDYTQTGGGTYSEVRRVSAVNCSMTWHDLSAANLSRAVFGDSSAIASGSVSNEEQTAYVGGLVATANAVDTAQTVTVVTKEGSAASNRANSTAYAQGDYYVPAVANGYFYKCTTAGTSAGSPPTFGTTVGGNTTDGTAVFKNMGKITLVLNTDFTVSGAGIALDSAASIVDGEVVKISYTKSAASRVEALLKSAQEYELVFAGLNEARSGKAVNVHAYRVKLGATQNLSLIGDDYAALELSGKVLKDTTKNGTSVSQYFKVDVVN